MQLFKLGQYVCIKKHKCGVIKKKSTVFTYDFKM